MNGLVRERRVIVLLEKLMSVFLGGEHLTEREKTGTGVGWIVAM